MVPRSTLMVVLTSLFATRVAAHGAMTYPMARNYFDPSRQPDVGTGGPDASGRPDFQSGNGYGNGPNFFSEAGGSPCGDERNSGYSSPGWHYKGRNVDDPLGNRAEGVSMSDMYLQLRADKAKWGYFQPGGTFDVHMTITGYHGGKFALYLCPWHPGTDDFDYEECGVFKSLPRFNTSSPYFIDEYELPENFILCQNCMDETINPRVEHNGRNWSLVANYDPSRPVNDQLCGYSEPFINPTVGECSFGMVADGNGCQGPAAGSLTNCDGTSKHIIRDVRVPPALMTEDAVLVWHWITANNPDEPADAEQFMNCADMQSSIPPNPPAPPNPPFSPPAPPAPPPPPFPPCGDPPEYPCLGEGGYCGDCPTGGPPCTEVPAVYCGPGLACVSMGYTMECRPEADMFGSMFPEATPVKARGSLLFGGASAAWDCEEGEGTFSTNGFDAFCKVPAGTTPPDLPGLNKVRKGGVGAASYRGWTTCFRPVYPYGCGEGCLKVTCNGKAAYVATVDNQAGGPHVGDLWYPGDRDTMHVVAVWGATICGGNLCGEDGEMLTCAYESADSSHCWE